MASPLFTLSNVEKCIRDTTILSEIDLTLYKGEVLGIIGPSGAGKTSLLQILLGYYSVTNGHITYKGTTVQDNLQLVRQHVGFASQEPSVYQELTVEENLRYFGQLHDLSYEDVVEREDKVLDFVNLQGYKKRLAEDLSGGMNKRLDVACALLHKPEVLIMDEPTAGLDPVLRREMWKLIDHIHDNNTTLVLTSHVMRDIEHLCSRVGMLFDGQLHVTGTPEQIKNMYTQSEEIQLKTHPGNYDALLRSLQQTNVEVRSHRRQDSKLILYVDKAETALYNIVKSVESQDEQLISIDVERPALREVFQSFTEYYDAE